MTESQNTKRVGRVPRGFLRRSAPVVATLFLLGGLAVEKFAFHLPPADAAPYHARLRDTSDAMPYNIGPWLGADVELPPSAIKLLHPNTFVSRSYQHVRTGKVCTFLLVQCEDARDLLGHYPPVCYVNHGWVRRSTVTKDWQVDDLKIQATRYTFETRRLERTTELCVDNFMVLPNGQFCRDMEGVQAAAQDYRRKFFGAAQVQVIADPGMPDAEREALFRQFVSAARPLIDAIRGGVAE